MPREITNLEWTFLLQLIIFYIEDHGFVVSSQSQIYLVAQVLNLAWKVVNILGYFVCNRKSQSIIFVVEHSDSVIKFTWKVEDFTAWFSSADCAATSSFHFDWFLFAPGQFFIRVEIIPIDNVSSKVRDEENIIIIWKSWAVRVRTGLTIWVDAAAFMSDKRVNWAWDVISEPTDKNGGTWVVGDHNESTCSVDGGLARVISQGLNSGNRLKLLVESNKKTLFVFGQNVVVTITFDNIWWVDLWEDGADCFIFTIEVVNWGGIFSIWVRPNDQTLTLFCLHLFFWSLWLKKIWIYGK